MTGAPPRTKHEINLNQELRRLVYAPRHEQEAILDRIAHVTTPAQIQEIRNTLDDDERKKEKQSRAHKGTGERQQIEEHLTNSEKRKRQDDNALVAATLVMMLNNREPIADPWDSRQPDASSHPGYIDPVREVDEGLRVTPYRGS